jgi:bifunctional non-homologous end joining protein LigD
LPESFAKLPLENGVRSEGPGTVMKLAETMHLSRMPRSQRKPRKGKSAPSTPHVDLPKGLHSAELILNGHPVRLTNLRKVFWPELKLTKRDLLQYYIDVAPVLLPHLQHRAMVMKRYPNGASGEFFFMKRAPVYRPESLQVCSIEHNSGNVIEFPVIEDLSSLLWVVNLGCIDLNPWYARCDDVNRPDYLHFDLDPVPGATFSQVLETALWVREALESLHIPCYPKTTGSRGIHVYVPIERGPTQKQVWAFAKQLARTLAAQHAKLITAEYRVAKRPAKHVLVDYNQNAWGRTLASVYSVRPKPRATVSTPVTWDEIERGISTEDFRIDNVPQRISRLGDLWKPLISKRGRFRLERFL